MAEGEGSINIVANVDAKKAQAELNRLDKRIEKLNQTLNEKRGQKNAIADQLETARVEADKTSKAIEELRKELEKTKEIQDPISKHNLSKPIIGEREFNEYIGAQDREKAITAELVEQEKSLSRQDLALEKLDAKYMQLYEAVAQDEAELAAAETRAGELSSELTGASQGAEQLGEGMKEAGAEGEAAGSKLTETMRYWYERMSAFVEKLLGETKYLNGELEESGDKAKKAGDTAAEAGGNISSAMQRASDKISKIGKKLISMVRRAFLFSIITRALRGVREYFSNILNSTPEFTAALGQLKSAFLTLAQPLVSVIIPALTSLLQVITKIVTVIASLVAQLFGTTFERSQEAAEALNEQAEAYKETGSAAKKASKQIAAFDQLNILSDTNSGGGASKAKFDLPGIGEIKGFEKVREWFENLNFEPILEAWERLKESFSGLKETIGDEFSWFWDNVLAPLAKWTIEEAAPRMVDLLAKAFGFLDAVLERLGPILEPLWNNVLKPFIKWLGELVLTGLDELIDLLDKLTKLINGEISWKEFWEGLDGTKKAILLFLGAIVAKKAITMILGLAGAFGKFGTSVASNLAKAGASIDKGPKLVSALKKVALGVFDALMIAYDTQKLIAASKTYREAQEAHNRETEVALESYRKLYEEKGKEVADEWAKMVYNVDTSGDDLITAQERIAGQIETYWDDVPQNMWEGFKQGWNDYFVTGEKGGLIGLIGDAFQGVIDWVKQILGINSPSTVFRDIGDDMVQGLWDGFKATWDNFSSWLSGAWEGIKRWWNGLSLKSPTIQTTTNANGFSHYSGSFGIPGLASGAVIPPNREFLAVLGDQNKGTNIEAPLDTIVQAFRQALGERRGSQRTIILQVDRHELGRVTFDAYNAESQRVGMKLGG